MHVKSHHVDLILDPWSRAEKGEEGGGCWLGGGAGKTLSDILLGKKS